MVALLRCSLLSEEDLICLGRLRPLLEGREETMVGGSTTVEIFGCKRTAHKSASSEVP